MEGVHTHTRTHIMYTRTHAPAHTQRTERTARSLTSVTVTIAKTENTNTTQAIFVVSALVAGAACVWTLNDNDTLEVAINDVFGVCVRVCACVAPCMRAMRSDITPAPPLASKVPPPQSPPPSPLPSALTSHHCLRPSSLPTAMAVTTPLITLRSHRLPCQRCRAAVG